MRPIRERQDNVSIDANGKVTISNWMQFSGLRRDLPACRQYYQLNFEANDYLILVSREGRLITNCAISLKLSKMKVIELIPIHHYINEILVMSESRSIYWCLIVDDELTVLTRITRSVRQAVVVGNDINGSLMTLCIFNNSKFKMIITNPATRSTFTVDISVDNVEWIEGESHGKSTTIVCKDGRLIMLDWKGELFDINNSSLYMNHIPAIPDMLDVIRMEDYWMILRSNQTASILITKDDSDRIRARFAVSPYPHIRARKDSLRIASSLILPTDNELFSMNIGNDFIRFLNEKVILDKKGGRCRFEHDYLTGIMVFNHMN